MGQWDLVTKSAVRKMRESGATFGVIRKVYLVPKSTLSNWCRNLPKPDHLYYKNRLEWLIQIRKKSSEVLKNKRNLEVEEIAKRVKGEVDSWDFLENKSIQKAFLSLLYWAEGQKLPLRGGQVRFANTDPRLMLLFLTLLRRCYALDESKLRVRVHLHWYHNAKKVKRFWMELLGMDELQMLKPILKRRSKVRRFRKNFAGICFINYSSVDLRWEIVDAAYNIQERITGENETLHSWLNGQALV